jgi:hypothetical protein
MTKRASVTAMEQAAKLTRLVGVIPVESRLWTAEERKLARALVMLLCEHSLAAEKRP